MTKAPTAAGYISFQRGFSIFGTGTTADAAIADAPEWGRTWYDDGELVPLKTMPATAALMDKFKSVGGVIGWAVVDGIAALPEELDGTAT